MRCPPMRGPLALAVLLDAGCVHIAGVPADPEGVGCIRDYDGCLGLAVDPSICQSIYDACSGSSGASTGSMTSGGGGCWDQVQSCLEDNNGDEGACAALIDECLDDDGTQTTAADGGPSDTTTNDCPGGNDTCGTDPSGELPPDCNDQFAECLHAGQSAPECAAQLPDCGISDECAASISECLQSGATLEECIAQDAACGPIDPQPDECQAAYDACLEQYPPDEGEAICQQQLQECLGQPLDPDPIEVCWQVAQACQADPALVEQGLCEAISTRCANGAVSQDCVQAFYGCAGVQPGELDWGQVESGCISEFAACR